MPSILEVTVLIDHCKFADIVVDDERIVEKRENCTLIAKTTGNYEYLNGLGPIQIAGIENMPLEYPSAEMVKYAYFRGCIRKITENLEMYDLAYPVKIVNASSSCPIMAKCPDCNGSLTTRSDTTKWYIILIGLICGILSGIMLVFSIKWLQRRLKRQDNNSTSQEHCRTPQNNCHEDVDNVSAYAELNQQTRNVEDNYQHLKKKSRQARNNEAPPTQESNYQELNVVRGAEESNYQSLNRV